HTARLSEENHNHLVSWLIYYAKRYPSSLSAVVEFLAGCHASGASLPLDSIREFIESELPIRAEAAHTHEVAWLLFLARELKLKISSLAITRVHGLRSSVCALLLLELNDRGLIEGAVDVTFWATYANSEGLQSEMCYLHTKLARRPGGSCQ